MSTATITIGPEHDGQNLSLGEFEKCARRGVFRWEPAGRVVDAGKR